jgi:hypothetical protein
MIQNPQLQMVHDSVDCFCAGNGSQWPKMGRDLIEQNVTFRENIKSCASALTPLGLDLLEAFEKDDGFSDNRLAAVGLASVQVPPRPITAIYICVFISHRLCFLFC